MTIQKIDFLAQISKFLVRKSTFSPLAANRSLTNQWFQHKKRCLIGLPIWGYQKFYSLPPKNWIFSPKTAKFGRKLAFLAKYQHFWPIWSNAWPKNNADKLSRWFSVMLVPKLLLTPIKIRIFGPKTAKFGPKSAFLVILGQILPFFAHFRPYRPIWAAPSMFWSFWAKYWHFWPTLSHARPKNNANKVPRLFLRYVGTKNDQIWPNIDIFGEFGPGHAGLFNALLWVGWWLWRAGCISQDIYLLY